LKNEPGLVGSVFELGNFSDTPTATPHDDATLIIDFEQLKQSVARNTGWIVLVFVLFVLVTGAYVFGNGFHERYHSEATLLYNPAQIASVISTVENGRMFSDENNVFKNQQEIFESRVLAERVLQELRQQDPVFWSMPAEQLRQNYLQADHIRNSDFMKLSATAETPKKAVMILNHYLKQYDSLMNELTIAPLKEQEKLYSEQLKKAEDDLTGIETILKQYQKTYGIVDIVAANQSKINQLETLSIQTGDIQRILAEKQAEALRIRQQLRLDRGQTTSAAILSVANGQNSLLNELQNQLQNVQKDYLSKSKVFTSTNPDMVDLKNQLEVLQQQVREQQVLTLGQPALPGNMLQIKDTVRASMIAQLATSEALVAAMNRKLSISQQQLAGLQQQLKALPEQQIDYIRLKAKQESKENVVVKLRDKLTEVTIQEAAIGQKLTVMDPPSSPKTALFPTRLHLVAGVGVLGILLATLFFMAKEMLIPRHIRPWFMEKVIKVPVLAIIPWIPDSTWKRSRKTGTLDVLIHPVNPEVLNGYQDFALSLKARNNTHTNRNALSFATLMIEPHYPAIIGNLAYCLAQSGDRVIVVDANLRNPTLHHLFQQPLNYELGLTELVNRISELLFNKPDVPEEELFTIISRYLLPSRVHSQLFYINAGVKLENPFEFLNSKGFLALVQALKKQYDWVLFHSPPFLGSPDTAVELGYLDGIVLLVDKLATEQQLYRATQKITSLQAWIAGCVMRS
jgi:polysaccharide biosynthesis transport protein